MNSPISRHLEFINSRCMASCLLALAWLLANSVIAQEKPPQSTQPPAASPAPQPATSAELMDGLLELLNEPAKPTETPGAKDPSANTPSVKPPLTPSDVGLDGEDLGEAPENPLQAVRQSMLIAAGYLSRDGANAETMKLQSDIVKRLDDLIAEMEKSQGQQGKSNQDSQEQSSASSKTQQQQNQQGTQSMKTRSGERQESNEQRDGKERAGEPENPPTQRGAAGAIAVELSDPRALQQDVWGQLPSRVRQQMQSRMVEQFLPAYREQIEAYFQALLK